MNGQTTMIKIASVERQFKQSNYGDGQYAITTVTDVKTGLKGTAMGPFAENWKEGDEVEVKWEENNWTNREGVAQQGWRFKNPNAKPAPNRNGDGGMSTEAEGRIIAATLLAPAYAGNIQPSALPEIMVRVKAMGEAITKELTPPAPVAPAPAAPVAAAPVAPVTPPTAAPVAPAAPAAAPVAAPAAAPVAPIVADDKPF